MMDGGTNRYKMEFYVQAFNPLNRDELPELRREPDARTTTARALRRDLPGASRWGSTSGSDPELAGAVAVSVGSVRWRLMSTAY